MGAGGGIPGRGGLAAGEGEHNECEVVDITRGVAEASLGEAVGGKSPAGGAGAAEWDEGVAVTAARPLPERVSATEISVLVGKDATDALLDVLLRFLVFLALGGVVSRLDVMWSAACDVVDGTPHARTWAVRIADKFKDWAALLRKSCTAIEQLAGRDRAAANRATDSMALFVTYVLQQVPAARELAAGGVVAVVKLLGAVLGGTSVYLVDDDGAVGLGNTVAVMLTDCPQAKDALTPVIPKLCARLEDASTKVAVLPTYVHSMGNATTAGCDGHAANKAAAVEHRAVGASYTAIDAFCKAMRELPASEDDDRVQALDVSCKTCATLDVYTGAVPAETVVTLLQRAAPVPTAAAGSIVCSAARIITNGTLVDGTGALVASLGRLGGVAALVVALRRRSDNDTWTDACGALRNITTTVDGVVFLQRGHVRLLVERLCLREGSPAAGEPTVEPLVAAVLYNVLLLVGNVRPVERAAGGGAAAAVEATTAVVPVREGLAAAAAAAAASDDSASVAADGGAFVREAVVTNEVVVALLGVVERYAAFYARSSGRAAADGLTPVFALLELVRQAAVARGEVFPSLESDEGDKVADDVQAALERKSSVPMDTPVWRRVAASMTRGLSTAT